MTSHRNDDEQKVLLQTRVSECLEQEIKDYSREVLGEENPSWAVRNILKKWTQNNKEVPNHNT